MVAMMTAGSSLLLDLSEFFFFPGLLQYFVELQRLFKLVVWYRKRVRRIRLIGQRGRRAWRGCWWLYGLQGSCSDGKILLCKP